MQIDKWTREQCEEYLMQYPKSLNSDTVRKRLQFFDDEQKRIIDNKDNEFWQCHNDNVNGIIEYLKKYPRGRHAFECDDILWAMIKKPDEIYLYKKSFPHGNHTSECSKIEQQNKPKASPKKNSFYASNDDARKTGVAKQDPNSLLQKQNDTTEILKGIGRTLLIIAGVAFVVFALVTKKWSYSIVAPVAYYTSRLMKD